VIVKSNDDVRQEVFIMQLIAFYEEIFKQNGVGIWLRPYKIMSTGNSTGLIAVCVCVLTYCVSPHGAFIHSFIHSFIYSKGINRQHPSHRRLTD